MARSKISTAGVNTDQSRKGAVLPRRVKNAVPGDQDGVVRIREVHGGGAVDAVRQVVTRQGGESNTCACPCDLYP